MNTLKDVISKQMRKNFLIFISTLLFVFTGLLSFLAEREYVHTRNALKDWTNFYKPQIEQSLFLENTLAISGIVEHLPELNFNFTGTIAVFDSSGKLIAGSKHLGTLNAKAGYRFNLRNLSIDYTTSLNFADKKIGTLAIRGFYSLLTPLLYGGGIAILC